MATMKTDGPDKQREFIRKQLEHPSVCPGCLKGVNGVEACTDKELNVEHIDRNNFKCPHCGIILKWTLPFPAGGWYWRRNG